MISMTRRQTLAATAALPMAGAVGAARSAGAQGASATPQFNQFQRGAFEVTTLLVGTAIRDEVQTIFGRNVSEEEFNTVSEQNFLPTSAAQFYFTPTLVNTGEQRILFDTGLSAAQTVPVLEAAGYTAGDIDIVVITHMHGDHIGGLMDGETETYVNATYVTAAAENNHWSQADNENYAAKVAPLIEQFSFIDDGASVASGVTAMAAFGHTPGHMIYRIESEGEELVVFADTANHYVWSLAYPDWEVRFDMDHGAAAQTRRAVLSMLAAERIPFVGYHMPFPATGYVEQAGDGFRYVPSSYQFAL